MIGKRSVFQVPVAMQMENLECGAASLCMILAYFKKWLPLEQVRADCAVSRDGCSARNILRAARFYGLTAAGYRLDPKDLQELEHPVILHWNFNHFVVFCGFKKKVAVLNDPARGRVEVTLEEFERAFTGIVLKLEPGPDFRPEGKPKSIWGFARKRLRGSLVPFLLIVCISILTAAAGLLPPLFSRIFLDNILTGSNPEWLQPFLAVSALIVFFQFLTAASEAIYWLKMEGRFAITANAEYVWHVLRLPMEFFSQRYIGDIVSRQNLNQTIAGTLMRQLAPVFMNVCLLLFYLLIMIRYSVVLSLIGITAVGMNILSARWIAKNQVNLNRTLQIGRGRLAGNTVTGIHMVETIKASGAENGFFERWAGYFAQQHNAEVRITRFTQYLGSIPQFIQQISSVAILICGVHLILDGDFTVGIRQAC